MKPSLSLPLAAFGVFAAQAYTLEEDFSVSSPGKKSPSVEIKRNGSLSHGHGEVREDDRVVIRTEIARDAALFFNIRPPHPSTYPAEEERVAAVRKATGKDLASRHRIGTLDTMDDLPDGVREGACEVRADAGLMPKPEFRHKDQTERKGKPWCAKQAWLNL